MAAPNPPVRRARRTAQAGRAAWTSERAARARAEAWRAARRARREVLVLGPLLVAVLFIYDRRHAISPGVERNVRYATVVALLVLGRGIARDLGRAMGPQLLRRLDPSTAGSV